MRTHFNLRFIAGLVGVLAACPAGAAITVECLPVGGPTITGGQAVDVECFVSTDVDQEFWGYLLDLACSLPPTGGSSGTVSTASIEGAACASDADCPGASRCWRGGCVPVMVNLSSSSGVPWLIYFSGGRPTSLRNCAVGGTTHEAGLVTLEAGRTAYLVTIVYEVSPCALGSFDIILENFSDPPDDNDGTRFWDVNDHSLIPFAFTPTTLTVETGTCCSGMVCLEDDINGTCCELTYPGATFIAGVTCGDANPCAQACCLSSGPCAMMNPQSCTEQGGIPLGRDDECSSPQACCFAAGRCADLDPLCCADGGGTSLGSGTTCEGDADDDGVDAVCGDACPNDPNDDSDLDGVCDSNDLCPGLDDRVDADNNTIPDCLEAIPTLSTWGLVVLTLLLLIAWKIRFRNHPTF